MHHPSVAWGGGTAFVIGLSRQPCDARKTYAPNRAAFRTRAERKQGKGVDVADDPARFPCPGRSQRLALAQSRVTDEEIPLHAG